jgi:hypothetical protein
MVAKLRRGVGGALLAGLALALLACAQAQAAPLVDCTSFTACIPHDGKSVDPTKFDVLWLRLWMTPGAVKAVLQKEFGRKIRIEPVSLPSQLGKGSYIAQISASTADYAITVHFIEIAPTAGRRGPVADELDVKLTPNKPSSAAAAVTFTNKALTKYGPPSLLRSSLAEAPYQVTWCQLMQGQAGTGALVFPWAECEGATLTVTLPTTPDYTDMAVIEQALQSRGVLQLPLTALPPGSVYQPSEMRLSDTSNPLEDSVTNDLNR